MKVFEIKDINAVRYFPAFVYEKDDNKQVSPIIDEEQVYGMLLRDGKLNIAANRFDQDNNELEFFRGMLVQTDILRITQVDYWHNAVNLDMIMSLSEAAEKWGLADGASIRMAIERGKFKANEIKRCGHVWIVTYPGMQRVFGTIEDRANDLSLSYNEIAALFSQIVGTCFSIGIYSFFKRKHPEVDFSKIDAAVRLKIMFTKALACFDQGGRVILRWYILPDSSTIKNVLNSRSEFFQWLERLDHPGTIIQGKLREFLFPNE